MFIWWPENIWPFFPFLLSSFPSLPLFLILSPSLSHSFLFSLLWILSRSFGNGSFDTIDQMAWRLFKSMKEQSYFDLVVCLGAELKDRESFLSSLALIPIPKLTLGPFPLMFLLKVCLHWYFDTSISYLFLSLIFYSLSFFIHRKKR